MMYGSSAPLLRAYNHDLIDYLPNSFYVLERGDKKIS